MCLYNLKYLMILGGIDNRLLEQGLREMEEMNLGYLPRWDLDVFFEGGSNSPQFAAYLQSIKEDIEALDKIMSSWTCSSAGELKELLDEVANLEVRMSQSGGFISCLEAQDTTDRKASQLKSEFTGLSAAFMGIMTKLEERIAALDEDSFQSFIREDSLKELAFILQETRERSQEKLSVKEETLIQKLSVDGYHGWGQLYSKIVSSLKIPVEVDGRIEELSVGQAANAFASPDRNMRKQVFEEWEKAWKSKEDLLAHTLNALAGFRLKVYESRGWEDVLKEPLSISRMDRETLDSMWAAINDAKPMMAKFLQRKAEILGVEKLSWYDLEAPLTNGTQLKMAYDEGAAFILKHFGTFGEQLTAFTKGAFEDRWIEAEDRPNKRPGGFCTEMPESGQSRIFMTYSGTLNNVSTLAHELGHAFHSYALRDIHPLNRDYAMNVAETASTFAEMIVSSAAVAEAVDGQEKIAMLEDKIQRTIALLMNIHARFLFETRFYEERKRGAVPAGRLNELMEEAQKEAYYGALEEYHPAFWASKLHFFITSTPFYNFPYTFGYLFSLGIYELAIESDGDFEGNYINLLKDTGSMKTEDLAMKHLGEDIRQKSFWDKAVRSCVKDIEEFLELTSVAE